MFNHGDEEEEEEEAQDFNVSFGEQSFKRQKSRFCPRRTKSAFTVHKIQINTRNSSLEPNRVPLRGLRGVYFPRVLTEGADVSKTSKAPHA